ncbi:MAG TPA: hypothetical protein VN750_14230 [Steroidobacteraceae bacterium]|nr:hypothetical protein [Steroidobacteraceae bacterium]
MFMKRYFLFDSCPPKICVECPPGHCGSLGDEAHWVSLPDEAGSIMVLMGKRGVEDVNFPPSGCRELPHVLDTATPANFNGINSTPGPYVPAPGATPLEAMHGITHTDNTLTIALKLCSLNPNSPFRP